MIEDRRAGHPARHIWQKPNWVGPIVNALAVVFVGVIALDDSGGADQGTQVNGVQIDRSGVTVQLVDGTVVVTCGTASQVPLTLIRKYGEPESVVVCQQSGMVLP